MARLRKEEEARSYEKMLHPPSESFASRFSSSSQGHLFPPTQQETSEEDEVTYADINRQMALIANVLISIIACSVAIWKAAWHWEVPARLALSMAGSITVAVAEVAIYAGYLGRIQDAKRVERKKVEKKVVAESWVIEGRRDAGVENVKNMAKEIPVAGMRQRTAHGEK
jgi:TMEM199 family protein